MAAAATNRSDIGHSTTSTWQGTLPDTFVDFRNSLPAPDTISVISPPVTLQAPAAASSVKRPACELDLLFHDSASVTGIHVISNARVVEIYYCKPVFPRQAAGSMRFAYLATARAQAHGSVWRCSWDCEAGGSGIAADALRVRCLRLDEVISDTAAPSLPVLQLSACCVAATPAAVSQRASAASTQAASRDAAAALAMTVRGGGDQTAASAGGLLSALLGAARCGQPGTASHTPAATPTVASSVPTVSSRASSLPPASSVVANLQMASLVPGATATPVLMATMASSLESAVRRIEAAVEASEGRLAARLAAVEARLDRIEQLRHSHTDG